MSARIFLIGALLQVASEAVTGSDASLFIQELVHHTIAVGSNLTLTASVVGEPPISYQWQRNGAVSAGNDQIGAVEGKEYSGDGLSVTATAQGARLRCMFQRLEGEATSEGLWLASTVTNMKKDRFRVVARAVRRVSDVAQPSGLRVNGTSSPRCAFEDGMSPELAGEDGCPTALPQCGSVSTEGNTVRFIRPGVLEEYRVSMDGLRQDFVLLEKPAAASVRSSRCDDRTAQRGEQRAVPTISGDAGELRVELAVTGARVEQTAYGAQLVLENSGRKIAYSRLRVTDANRQELPARMEVVEERARFEMPMAAAGTIVLPISTGVFDEGIEHDTRGVCAPMLVVVVNDAKAVYPIRIDPTFSDANWISLNPSIPGAGGTVNSAVVDGSGNLYLGGSFTAVGDIVVNYIAKWNGSSWSALGSGMNTTVYALAVSGADLYAGGAFTSAGGSTANYIAKWNGSNWSALGSGMNKTVYALAVSGSDWYAGGDFTTAGGVSANRIAKWNGSNWSALGSGIGAAFSQPTVLALAVSGGDLYAGGHFTTAGGSAANYIAKWDGSGWSALGSGLSGYVIFTQVSALAVSGGNLYAGGDFKTAGGSAANLIAKWDGTSWSALGSGITGVSPHVSALAVSGTDVYVGGKFTMAGESAAANVAKWNGSGWSALSSGLSDSVYAVAISGSDLYAGGRFTMAGGSAANFITKWNGSGWSALSSGMNGYVYALAVSGADMYAGGNFTAAGVSQANSIAKWNGSGWSALGSGVNGLVYALAVSGSDLYAGGSFTMAGGVAAERIAKWDGSGWSALGSGLDNYVYALAVSGSDLYAGGRFFTASGVVANYIAKWNGSSWSALGSGMGSSGSILPSVRVLAVSGGDLYAGGNFTTAGGIAANNIAKWNESSWSALGSGADAPGFPSVFALAVSDSDVYAGGVFTTVGGSAASYIAKWNGSGWSALSSGMNGQVLALAVSGSDVYAGGSFTMAGGSAANFIAKWNGSGWSALGSGMGGGSDFVPSVFALALSGGGLYAGGYFTTAGGKVSGYIAKALLNPLTFGSFAVSDGTFHALLSGPASNTVVVDSSATLTNWTPAATNSLPAGGWPLTLPIGTNVRQFYRARFAK